MIYYQIYNIINKINGKNYIGVHKQESRERDNYFGKGKIQKQVIKKYGRENLEKIILEVCETEKQAFFLEKRYIKFYRLAGLCQYNIAPGGEGGVIYECHPMLGKKGKDNPNYGQKRPAHSERMKGAGNPMYGKTGEQSTCFGRTGEKHPMFNKEHLEETKEQISETLKSRYASGERKKISLKGESNPFFGKTHSDEWRKNQSERMKGHKHFLDKKWYNNGIKSIRTFECPEGFNPGMLKRKT